MARHPGLGAVELPRRGGRHRSLDRHPGRPDRGLRVCGQGWGGQRPGGQGRAHARVGGGSRKWPQWWRKRRDRGSAPAQQRLEGFRAPNQSGVLIMGLSELCIRRPVLTTLVTATFIVFGLFGYRLLGVAALPSVDFPTIVINTNLPGASAETMASSVAAPIERQLSTISGISALTSTSTLGRAKITIQFALDRNIDGAALDVQTALTVAQKRLPIEMTTPPSFRKVNPGDSPILFIALSSATLPIQTVDDYAEITLAQQISQLPGIAQVGGYGAQQFAIRA